MFKGAGNPGRCQLQAPLFWSQKQLYPDVTTNLQKFFFYFVVGGEGWDPTPLISLLQCNA